MKIGFLACDYPPVLGGISRLSADLVRFLARRWPVQVFLCDRDAAVPVLADHPPVEKIPFDRAARNAGPLIRLLRARGVTHLVFNYVDLAGPFLLAGLRCAGFKTAVIIHGADINIVRPLRPRLRLAATLALHTHRIANSEGTRAILSARFHGLPAHVVRPGITMPPAPVGPDGGPREGIVAVGRFVRRKGFDTLLDALARLREQGLAPPAKLIGDGPDAAMLRERIAALGLGGQVRIAGGLTDAEVRTELLRHRVFCLLPRELPDGNIEGFGIVFLEAAMAGLPSVAGHSGGVPDAVADGESGFLVDPASPAAVAARLRELLTDDALWRRMSAAAVAWARRFDWAARDPAAEFPFLPAP